jgi:hypothetical protein
MIETIENNPVYWILALALIALICTLFGLITGAKLPTEERKIHTRKFALIGAAVFFSTVPIVKPLIGSYSGVESLDKIEISELATTDQIVKLEKEQARQIERLKEEVIELRKDVRNANQYYSTIFLLVSNIVGMLCLTFAFRKDEKKMENISD